MSPYICRNIRGDKLFWNRPKGILAGMSNRSTILKFTDLQKGEIHIDTFIDARIIAIKEKCQKLLVLTFWFPNIFFTKY